MAYDGECSNISTSFTRSDPIHCTAKANFDKCAETKGRKGSTERRTDQPAVSAIDYLFSSCVDMYGIWEVVKVDHKYLTPKGFSYPHPPPHYSFFLSTNHHVTSLAAVLLNSRQLMKMGDEELDWLNGKDEEEGQKHIPSFSGLGDLLAGLTRRSYPAEWYGWNK